MDTLQSLNEGEFFITGEPKVDLLVRLVINIVSILILIRFIYYPNNSQIKYLFTFFLMGLMIFLIASILDQVKLDFGFAFGLFAIFGIVRYRSPSIDLKELTYLFLIIGLSVINALVEFNTGWFGLVVANIIIIGSTLLMELYKPKTYILKRAMTISLEDFSVLNNNEQFLQKIKDTTGIEVLKVEINKINKAKNEVTTWIYFEGRNESYLLEEEENPETQELSEEKDHWESNYSNDY